MKIEHIAIWVKDLENMRNFYETYFEATAGERYHNPEKKFTSYFLSFGDGARLELMHRTNMDASFSQNEQLGLAHFALSVGSEHKVDQLTERLKYDGFKVVGKPRTTGDGYYESVVLDPQDNRIEITA